MDELGAKAMPDFGLKLCRPGLPALNTSVGRDGWNRFSCTGVHNINAFNWYRRVSRVSMAFKTLNRSFSSLLVGVAAFYKIDHNNDELTFFSEATALLTVATSTEVKPSGSRRPLLVVFLSCANLRL